MESVEFGSVEELMGYFSVVGRRVGLRTSVRKGANERTKERELYCIRQYLTTLAPNEIIRFPIRLNKGESPDFILSYCECETWGAEVVEATTNDYQKYLANTEDSKEPDLLFGFDMKKSRGECGDAIWDGWVGDSPEREACAAILDAMQKKAKKIEAGKFSPLSRYDLLIYENVSAFFYDDSKAMKFLKNVVGQTPCQLASLGKVSIITGSRLYYDVTGNMTCFPIFQY